MSSISCVLNGCNGFIVDGHNRYAICRKHNIEFTTCEQEFPSRSAAKIWMIDEQTKRRNINELTRAYLIGTRHEEEKNISIGRPKLSHSDSIIGDNSTRDKISSQSGVSPKTVQRAAEFSRALNKVVENTGIKRTSILSGLLKSTMKDIVTLASIRPGSLFWEFRSNVWN